MTQIFPEPLSASTQAFIRVAYGVLMLGTLLWALPQWRRFFVSERWGGYAESSREIDLIQNPFGAILIALVWFSSVISVGFKLIAFQRVPRWGSSGFVITRRS